MQRNARNIRFDIQPPTIFHLRKYIILYFVFKIAISIFSKKIEIISEKNVIKY